MNLKLSHNIAGGIRLLDAVRAEFPLALAKALTFTAVDVRAAEVAEMRRAFDRPTPFTLRSLYLESATPQRLQARVYFKDRFGTRPHYLLPQVLGGSRDVKRFEFSLQTVGQMPTGWHAVPAAGARIDSYGNVSRGQLIQILSQLRITLVSGFTRNISTDRKKKGKSIRRAGGQYFAVPKAGAQGKLTPGIYQRTNDGGIKPVFIFVARTHYKRRFEFERVARSTADKVFAGKFDAAMRRATAGAR